MNNFNSFLDSALETAKVMANAASKKTEEVVEVSKLRLQVNSLNNELKQVYEKIGTMVYYAAKDHMDIQAALDVQIAKADQLREQLDELESRAMALRKTKKCSNCGAACPAEAHFCSRCGMIMEDEQPKEYYEVQPVEEAPEEAENQQTQPEPEEEPEEEEGPEQQPEEKEVPPQQ